MNEIHTYFTGSIGYLCQFILHRLESYNLLHNESKLIIYTFPDYCYIINNIFPDIFTLIKISTDGSIINNNYNHTHLIIPLINVIGNIEDTNRNIFEHYFPKYISNPITSDFNDDNITDFICLSPGFTFNKLYEKCNFTLDELYDIINKFSNYKIIIIGNEIINNQILNYNYSDYSNIIISDSIEKTIFYLKNCKFFVSKCCDLINLAKLCETKLIFIYGESIIYHQLLTPFNNIIICINNVNLIDEKFNTEYLKTNEILQNILFHNSISYNDYKHFILYNRIRSKYMKYIYSYLI